MSIDSTPSLADVSGSGPSYCSTANGQAMGVTIEIFARQEQTFAGDVVDGVVHLDITAVSTDSPPLLLYWR